MIIKNARVFTEDGSFMQGDVVVKDGRFDSVLERTADTDAANDSESQEIIDASGLIMIPGLVDIHFHGCKGADMCDGTTEALDVITAYEASVGVTSVCPATMTIQRDELLSVMKNAGDYNYHGGAHLVGINMEGPFLDPAKKGAHVEGYIRKPDIEFFRACNEAAGGMIKLVTLAPNMEGSEEFIRELHNEVVISIGHTAADYGCAAEAMKEGALHVTHLYNAMNPMGHREPGVIGAAADNQDCMVEMIGDGIHIHPVTVRNTFRLFGDSRVVLISDSMMATGMENGLYELGGQEVTMKDRKATLADGTIAGSATCLFDCMKCVISMGVPEREAILAATANPARSIGIYNEVGSLTPGKRADIVLTDEELNIVKVL